MEKTKDPILVDRRLTDENRIELVMVFPNPEAVDKKRDTVLEALESMKKQQFEISETAGNITCQEKSGSSLWGRNRKLEFQFYEGFILGRISENRIKHRWPEIPAWGAFCGCIILLYIAVADATVSPLFTVVILAAFSVYFFNIGNKMRHKAVAELQQMITQLVGGES
ncbi:MAG: hypothetical protein LAT67_08575 [Balneolales bacterium]|nr:hypothetical protein [Balneolales bacterium]